MNNNTNQPVLPALAPSDSANPRAVMMNVPVLPDLLTINRDGLALLELYAEPVYLLLVDPKLITHKDRMTLISDLRAQGVKVVVVPVLDVTKAMAVYEAKPQEEYLNELGTSTAELKAVIDTGDPWKAVEYVSNRIPGETAGGTGEVCSKRGEAVPHG